MIVLLFSFHATLKKIRLKDYGIDLLSEKKVYLTQKKKLGWIDMNIEDFYKR